MSLTNAECHSAQPREKPYKLFDEHGMYLLVTPTSKLWRLKYYIGKAERSMALGQYPLVPLKLARQRRDDARRLVEQGKDPVQERRREELMRHSTFLEVANECIAEADHKPNTLDKMKWLLTRLKTLHSRSVADITAPEVFAAVQRIEREGKHESAHRANMLIGRTLRYAIVTGRRTERDVSADLRGALKPVEVTSHAAITDPTAFGALLRAIDSYEGSVVVRRALRLAPLVFVRPGELRGAVRTEFDLDRAEWIIPAERMKMGRDHLVPLSRQALDIVAECVIDCGPDDLLFPGRGGRPMSENAVTAALRRMFYSGDEMTGHGFRSSASTLLNESTRWPAEVIELQLAHQKKNRVAAIYDRSQRVPERREMMQWWADYLDELRTEPCMSRKAG